MRTNQRDDVIAMLVGFYMATAQGAAFRNLRIIAQVLANKTAGPKSRPDDFIMWTDALKGLLPEEAILLATLLKNDRDLASERNNGKVFQATRDALVGADLPFGSPEEFVAVCGALMRTGFVVALSAWGGLIYAPSPRLVQLAKMARLQDWADNVSGDP